MAHQASKSIIVNRNVADVYEVWSNFENFPHFMQNIEAVTKTGAKTSHWVMNGPLGFKVEWDADTTTLEPNSRIAWNSRDNGDIKTSGQVTFNELSDNQTEVTVTLAYEPPAGIAGDLVAKLFGNPEGKLEEDLRNFKTYLDKHTK